MVNHELFAYKRMNPFPGLPQPGPARDRQDPICLGTAHCEHILAFFFGLASHYCLVNKSERLQHDRNELIITQMF